ncbi:hypothetical protein FKG94_15890 [Exilibacterium tricleocarpae]|uniref:Uncharacterized protein n=1 Tax=Exilibacterium tricleocarpae TaxID=2591008 RepID=A0A545TBA7_9GAMM|nr:hypothetical protein [Exilibacterium tricleocarpae]TQV74498.1 hypothetical protein FKG94_15890 [Exilibacterium tricleocarpae]
MANANLPGILDDYIVNIGMVFFIKADTTTRKEETNEKTPDTLDRCCGTKTLNEVSTSLSPILTSPDFAPLLHLAR